MNRATALSHRFVTPVGNFALVVVLVLGSVCVSALPARADACLDLKSQYAAAFRAYQASAFRFPEDCPGLAEYIRGKRQQAQSLVSLSHSADQACSGSAREHGPPIEGLIALFDHDIARLQAGCDVITGASSMPPSPQQPPPMPAAAPPVIPPPAPVTPTPAPVPAAAPQPAPQPPAPAVTAQPAPQSGAQSCAAQKTMPVAAGCNADFPQKLTGQACTAADNSVGLTLQVPGSEPTCCVTACGLAK